jgi:hypothetical protein
MGRNSEAMMLGGELYFRTLVEYLTHFAGRFAVPVTAFGPAGAGWDSGRVGQGKRLFTEPGDQVPLTLTGSETFGTGLVHLSYEPAR